MQKRPITSRILFSVIAFAAVALLFQSCARDKCETTRTYTQFTPVYMSVEDFRDPGVIQSTSPQEIKNPGKIYIRENLIFINEYLKGVHVIDNSDPRNPRKVSFIEIPGNVDIAVLGNLLYADSHMDLLTINITDLQNATLESRNTDVFPQVRTINGVQVDPGQGLVVDFVEETITETVLGDCGGGARWNNRGGFRNDGFAQTTGGGNAAGGGGNGKNPMSPGIGGSMARFTLYSTNLYAVTENDLIVFSLTDPGNPSQGTTTNVGWGIETIFPYNDRLFIGSQRGMYVYDLQNPSNPSYISMFEHGTSCDPVVVEDDHAFVTLRGGTPCGGFTNQLDVVSISNIWSPRLVRTYPMTHPMGLGIDDGTLFICDDGDGLKVYDASNPGDLQMIGHEEGMDTYDVIPLQGSLMMIGSDGFFQYDYSDPNNMVLLSTIPVVE